MLFWIQGQAKGWVCKLFLKRSVSSHKPLHVDRVWTQRHGKRATEPGSCLENWYLQKKTIISNMHSLYGWTLGGLFIYYSLYYHDCSLFLVKLFVIANALHWKSKRTILLKRKNVSDCTLNYPFGPNGKSKAVVLPEQPTIHIQVLCTLCLLVSTQVKRFHQCSERAINNV